MSTVNKANIKPIPMDRYIITSSEVVKYLQEQLGFNIGADFTRWTGVSADMSYVRMRVVIAPDDIVAKPATTDIVDKMLAANAAGIEYQDRVINILKPFMYPENVGDLNNHPEDLERLTRIGLYNERLNDIIKFSKLDLCREVNLFRVYLRPERIIADMLADPTTNEIDGDMSITAIHGDTSETIRWEVAVTKNKNNFGPATLSMDRLFNR